MWLIKIFQNINFLPPPIWNFGLDRFLLVVVLSMLIKSSSYYHRPLECFSIIFKFNQKEPV
jgi:hypothetical protein